MFLFDITKLGYARQSLITILLLRGKSGLLNEHGTCGEYAVDQYITTQESASSWKVPQKITATHKKSNFFKGVPDRNDSADWG